jgi:RNA polymerase sigma factor for flagellar operon FliA
MSEGAIEDLAAPVPQGVAAAAAAEQALGDHLAAMATAMAVGFLAPTAHGEDGERTPLATGDDPEVAVSRAQLLDVVRAAVSELPKEEAELVRRHYLEGDRFDRVAEELGLSKSWASRLHTRALGRLAKKLRGL